MDQARPVQLRAPYLIFLGDIDQEHYGKTGKGLADWRPDLVAGQIRLAACAIDLGVPELTIAQAAVQGIGSLIIGVSPIGGQLPEHWFGIIKEAIDCGIDIVSGLHSRLADNTEWVEAARHSGSRLIDIRTPPAGISVGTGCKRSGNRILMVGTDCAVGKKYSALALTQALEDLGVKATFRATGQTGIMLAGSGIAVDAVIADFISGAAELVSPANDDDHWDIIEGQGSLFNPGYAAVSLGLLHGSQADALLMCHDTTRKEIDGWPGYPVPSLAECMQVNLQAGRLTNRKVRFAGLSINTSGLPASGRAAYLASLAKETGLPCVDPMIDGSAVIARYLMEDFCRAGSCPDSSEPVNPALSDH